MRKKERIPIIFEFFDKNPDILSKFIQSDDNNHINNVYDNHLDIKDYWNKYPDQRFGQVLINMGLIPNNGSWYVEETDWLIENEYLLPEEILFWGNNYDVNMNKLPETKYILLKDLKTDHIQNIIKFVEDQGGRLGPSYLNYFNKRIKEEEL